MKAYDELVQFAKDSKSINPNLLSDVLNGFIIPCPIMDKVIKSFYSQLKEL